MCNPMKPNESEGGTGQKPFSGSLLGSKDSSGSGSQPSPLTTVSARQVLTRIDVYRSPPGGLTDSLDILGTTSVSSEEGSDAPTVTLSFSLPIQLALLLAGVYHVPGPKGEIRYDLSFSLEDVNGT